MDDLKEIMLNLKTQLEASGLTVEGPDLIPTPIGVVDRVEGRNVMKAVHVDKWFLMVRLGGTQEAPSPLDIEISTRSMPGPDGGLSVGLTIRFLGNAYHHQIAKWGNWAEPEQSEKLWQIFKEVVNEAPELIVETVRDNPAIFSLKTLLPHEALRQIVDVMNTVNGKETTVEEMETATQEIFNIMQPYKDQFVRTAIDMKSLATALTYRANHRKEPVTIGFLENEASFGRNR